MRCFNARISIASGCGSSGDLPLRAALLPCPEHSFDGAPAVRRFRHAGAAKILRALDFCWFQYWNELRSRREKGPGEFHNIYTQPEAFDSYKSTGKFPEKTTFLLVVYEPAQKVSINKSGYFEGEMTAWPPQ